MKYTKSERKQHLKRQSMSGLSVAAYCEKQSINYHTFQNWRRRYKDNVNKNSSKPQSGSFVEVTLPEFGNVAGRTTIYLPNGIRLQLDRELDGGLLKLLSDV